jgi:3D-(3,5/4)-trihydroxycyclohexane-1,2-dione acylhydrolase (decyclizing)
MGLRLTAAQALVRFLGRQFVDVDDEEEVPYFAGVWAIFGHGNVARLGEGARATLPTFRAHNAPSRPGSADRTAG